MKKLKFKMGPLVNIRNYAKMETRMKIVQMTILLIQPLYMGILQQLITNTKPRIVSTMIK